MTRDVAIIGLGMTKFQEHWGRGVRELAAEAIAESLQDAQITHEQVQALFVGSMGRFAGQEHIGALVADYAGLTPIPATRVEAGCAGGALAMRSAFLAVLSGLYDIVVACGVEKMTDLTDSGDVISALGAAADHEWELQTGLTFSAVHALMARAHMAKYGTTKEQLAMVSAKNHKNAVNNPKAHFRREFNIEQILQAKMVCSPLGILDCSPVSDGAAAIIIAASEIADTHEQPIWIRGSGHASDTIALQDRKTITNIPAAQIAARRAYEYAGASPDEVNVAEVHDSFTIGEIMALEDLSFVPEGQGGIATESGETQMGGRIPVNTSGGLKARGNPIGATGIAQAIEIVYQLRGTAEKRQVENAEIGLTHSIGGSGATAIVTLLSSKKR
ncbi:MAG: thiolase domain-containing protein [Candidatus Heimdallarchaeota archaeon]